MTDPGKGEAATAGGLNSALTDVILARAQDEALKRLRRPAWPVRFLRRIVPRLAAGEGAEAALGGRAQGAGGPEVGDTAATEGGWVRGDVPGGEPGVFGGAAAGPEEDRAGAAARRGSEGEAGRMKVMLRAFQGKLKSDVLDWPEDASPTVRLLLDLPLSPVIPWNMADTPLSIERRVKPAMATFERQPGAIIHDGETVTVYTLVGVV